MSEFKKLVEKNGLNMRRWSEILGYSHDTLLSWSNGRNPPDKKAMKRLTKLSKFIEKEIKEK